MWAITKRDSALHQAVGDLPIAGSLAERRAAQLAAVLGNAGLSHLISALHGAQIRTLHTLTSHTLSDLQLKLGVRILSSEQWRLLGGLGLRREASGDAPLQRGMRRD